MQTFTLSDSWSEQTDTLIRCHTSPNKTSILTYPPYCVQYKAFAEAVNKALPAHVIQRRAPSLSGELHHICPPLRLSVFWTLEDNWNSLVTSLEQYCINCIEPLKLAARDLQSMKSSLWARNHQNGKEWSLTIYHQSSRERCMVTLDKRGQVCDLWQMGCKLGFD